MKIIIRLAVAALIVWLGVSQSCLAWNYSGHALIAQIAYEKLTPSVRQRVDQLTHVLSPYYGKMSPMRAAAWPDWIRRHDIEAFTHWHYINKPYMTYAAKPQSLANENVVWAIQHASDVLHSRHANDFEKAIFLRFMLHFVGDVHQPMHCISRYTPALPQGDAGGNLFRLRNSRYKSLHQLWDNGLGVFKRNLPKRFQDQAIKRYANRLVQKYPEQTFSRYGSSRPQDWAQESYGIAKHVAYVMPRHYPTPDYIKQGQRIVEQRVVLAGYRLARLLNQSLA